MEKKRLWIMAVLVFACLVVSAADVKAGRAESWRMKKWNMKKKYTVLKGGFRFHAYLSKDKKETWIYFVETRSKASGKSNEYPREESASKVKQAPSQLHFPQRIKGAKVTKIGADMTFVPKDELDFYQNVFGSWVEYAHDSDGYCNAVRNVRTMTLPRSLAELDESAFSGMRKLTKVDIPDAVKTLEYECFYGCKKLREVKLPKRLLNIRWTCFEDCPRLSKVTLPKSNRNFTTYRGTLLSKDKEKLVWVFPGKKDIEISDTVNSIKTYAFINSQVAAVHLGKNIVNLEQHCLAGKKLKDVTVDTGNSVFARDGQCIYRRSDGALAVGIATKKELIISDCITKLPENASLCGDLIKDPYCSLKVLDISASVKEMHAFCPVVSVSSRVCYRGNEPPKVIGIISSRAPVPVFCEVYVPKDVLEIYKKWYESLGVLDFIEKEDWHTF